MKKTLVATLFLIFSLTTFAQMTEAQLDDVVERTRKAFNVPGIAVGIIKDGKLVMAKGYGVTNIKTQEKVDANTLFAVASNSKAMTAAALGILVDKKKYNGTIKSFNIYPSLKCITTMSRKNSPFGIC